MSGFLPDMVWNDHLGWVRRWTHPHEPWPHLGAELRATQMSDDPDRLWRAEVAKEHYRAALMRIADLARTSMVDMADPAEDQAADWAKVARTAWTIAQDVLSNPLGQKE